jgi:N,N'-diacetyllegionaminate synthase
MTEKLEAAFTVGASRIGADEAPYFIAEAGSNFDQDMGTGMRLIDIAVDAGADAVKFQLFRADALYPDGGEIHAAFKAVELNPDWVPELARHAAEQDITFLASAFDRESVEVLESIDVTAHKIASSETTNLPLLDQIAASGRPLFLSTGMCDLIDVQEAVARCLARGNTQVALLQCGAMYPLPPEHAHLRVMDLFRDVFGAPVGFSDHSLGTHITLAAVARGANVIEKHFTHSRDAEGPDHFYALEPGELKQLISDARDIHAALGAAQKEMLPAEREFGRRDGLYAARDIPAGTVMTVADIEVRRPAIGLRARHRDAVIGMQATHEITAGAPLNWDEFRP